MRGGGSAGHRSLFTSKTYRGSCVAKEDSTVCHIPASAVLEGLSDSPAFARRFIESVSRDLIAAENALISFVSHSVPQRLAALLLRLKGEFGYPTQTNEIELRVPLTKVEISSMLGTSEETVVRTFNQFKRQGLVRFEGKKIFLTDVKTLEERR